MTPRAVRLSRARRRRGGSPIARARLNKTGADCGGRRRHRRRGRPPKRRPHIPNCPLHRRPRRLGQSPPPRKGCTKKKGKKKDRFSSLILFWATRLPLLSTTPPAAAAAARTHLRSCCHHQTRPAGALPAPLSAGRPWIGTVPAARRQGAGGLRPQALRSRMPWTTRRLRLRRRRRRPGWGRGVPCARRGPISTLREAGSGAPWRGRSAAAERGWTRAMGKTYK